MQELYAEQPLSVSAAWNMSEYRPLEGFVFAVTPFNFTSIAANLPTAPALLGNTVVWKPAGTAVFSGYYLMRLLEAAGLPPGVINFVPGDPALISEVALASPDLAGIHFTGSTAVFNQMWKTVGANIDSYRSYPRLVGETGGKDFILAHASADPEALAVAIARRGGGVDITLRTHAIQPVVDPLRHGRVVHDQRERLDHVGANALRHEVERGAVFVAVFLQHPVQQAAAPIGEGRAHGRGLDDDLAIRCFTDRHGGCIRCNRCNGCNGCSRCAGCNKSRRRSAGGLPRRSSTLRLRWSGGGHYKALKQEQHQERQGDRYEDSTFHLIS